MEKLTSQLISTDFENSFRNELNQFKIQAKTYFLEGKESGGPRQAPETLLHLDSCGHHFDEAFAGSSSSQIGAQQVHLK